MEVFKYSNIGCREINEDYVVSNDFGNGISLHLIADGMGGYEHGEVASKVVGESFVYAISKNMDVIEAASIASDNLRKEKHSLGIKKMGSTVAGVYIKDMEMTIFWAGDSRVYLYRAGDLFYQTEDHSLTNELCKVRTLTFEERDRYSHIVTRSLMGDKNDSVDIKDFSLMEGDEIFVCSDGLYKDCPVDYIIESIQKNYFDLDKNNLAFDDNHSLIYIKV